MYNEVELDELDAIKEEMAQDWDQIAKDDSLEEDHGHGREEDQTL